MRDTTIWITKTAFKDDRWKAVLIFYELGPEAQWLEVGSFAELGPTPEDALQNLRNIFDGKWPEKAEEVMTPAQISRYREEFSSAFL
jgi:hypothetical protein